MKKSIKKFTRSKAFKEVLLAAAEFGEAHRKAVPKMAKAILEELRMIRKFLGKNVAFLLLLLCAAPAWAVPLPLLDGSTYGIHNAFINGVNLVTSEFTAFGNNDDFATGVYQGVTYCQRGFRPCGTFPLTDFFVPIAVTYRLSPGEGAPCRSSGFSDCPEGLFPASLGGIVSFRTRDPFTEVTFEYLGFGVASTNAVGLVFHADFGPSFQTPEPATWLLLASGFGVMLWWRRRPC